MNEKKCNKCGCKSEEKDIHEHHVHPRFMDNPKGIGMKINLCEKCHNILHLIIPSLMWKDVNDKIGMIDFVKRYTLRYCNMDEEKDNWCYSCKRIIDIEDYMIENYCPYCNKSIKNYKEDIIQK